MSTKRDYECPDIEAMLTRMVNGLVRRAAEGDLEALTALRNTARRIDDEALPTAARGAHAFGYSWMEVGREIGITRQAAQQRFGREAV